MIAAGCASTAVYPVSISINAPAPTLKELASQLPLPSQKHPFAPGHVVQ